MVLTPIPSETADVEMEDASAAAAPTDPADNSWLLRQLPELPCFKDFYQHISSSLRTACQVENDPNTVGSYIQFLCHNALKELTGLKDLAELCFDMAQIIVERSTILPAILPGPLCKSNNAEETFYWLLRLFAGFMRSMCGATEFDFAEVWSTEHQEDVIRVVFENGGALLHFLVVHAQIILLTYRPSEKSREFYHELLSLWFQSSRVMPRAYLLEQQGNSCSKMLNPSNTIPQRTKINNSMHLFLSPT